MTPPRKKNAYYQNRYQLQKTSKDLLISYALTLTAGSLAVTLKLILCETFFEMLKMPLPSEKKTVMKG